MSWSRRPLIDFGLRDYGVEGQIGLERTPDEYVATMVAVFAEVRRVLRSDGVMFLNVGDSYVATTKGSGGHNPKQDSNAGSWFRDGRGTIPRGLKPKDLLLMPARLALALQADGWWVRSDIIWSKPNPMPESVTDRPTKAHEYVFLLSKSATYYWDQEAVREDAVHEGRLVKASGVAAKNGAGTSDVNDRRTASGFTKHDTIVSGRNLRSVWTIPTEPFSAARLNGYGPAVETDHFAAFPSRLAEICILAGTSERGVCAECQAPWRRVVERERVGTSLPTAEGTKNGAFLVSRYGAPRLGPNVKDHLSTTGWQPTCPHADSPTVPAVVLDPFSGAGTSGVVALRLGRRYVGLELSPAYVALSERRIVGDAPLLNTPGAVS